MTSDDTARHRAARQDGSIQGEARHEAGAQALGDRLCGDARGDNRHRYRNRRDWGSLAGREPGGRSFGRQRPHHGQDPAAASPHIGPHIRASTVTKRSFGGQWSHHRYGQAAGTAAERAEPGPVADRRAEPSADACAHLRADGCADLGSVSLPEPCADGCANFGTYSEPHPEPDCCAHALPHVRADARTDGRAHAGSGSADDSARRDPGGRFGVLGEFGVQPLDSPDRHERCCVAAQWR